MNEQRFKFSLRSMFILTSWMAFAAWLLSLGARSPFLPVIGVGVMAYFASKGCDLLAERCPRSVVFIPQALSALAIGFAAPFVFFGLLFYIFGLAR